MNYYRADLHIHSVLSPCGDLEMSPVNIIKKAVEQKLDIIGITDHNSTLHGPLIRKLGQRNNIYVLTGAEVTTREEVHCLTFFDNDDQLGEFQEYLETNLPFIKNKPSLFGHQVMVDESDSILKEILPLLIAGINQTLAEVELEVHGLGGLFIPAHVDKKVNSILENLGFFPKDLDVDAIEVQGNIEDFLMRHPELLKYTLLRNSDAHQINFIGNKFNIFKIEQINFDEIRMALHQQAERRIIL
ncbi:MAG TPA: PHP domain-containing protein [Bacteroidales bacterium]|nr:PHP domain-containing protein [Bacteroidales bacterium]